MQCHDKKFSVKTLTEDEDRSTEYIGMPPLAQITHHVILHKMDSKIVHLC